jgi:alpha-beta hydrolase superfamily lysophospholipase
MTKVMTSTSPDATFNYRGTDGAAITAYRWDPVGPPHAALQLSHGMGEHALRYGEFAKTLNGERIVVYGQDHRNHGASAKSAADLGQLGSGGWSMLVNDIHLLVELARSENPHIPLVLLGHSMGSFAAQQYLLDHSAEVEAVILTGTLALDLLEPGFDLDQPIELSALNVAFHPARTDFDWLSRDESVVDANVKDPLCGFGLDVKSGKEMFAGARRMVDPEVLRQIRSDLPIYISVGDLDPINRQLTLVEALVERFRTGGLTNVTVKSYPGARHEVLNETNRDDVVKDILIWLERAISRSTSSNNL